MPSEQATENQVQKTMEQRNQLPARYAFTECAMHNQSVVERLRKRNVSTTPFPQSTRQTEAIETARNNARSKLTSYLERLDETIITTRSRINSSHEISKVNGSNQDLSSKASSPNTPHMRSKPQEYKSGLLALNPVGVGESYALHLQNENMENWSDGTSSRGSEPLPLPPGRLDGFRNGRNNDEANPRISVDDFSSCQQENILLRKRLEALESLLNDKTATLSSCASRLSETETRCEALQKSYDEVCGQLQQVDTLANERVEHVRLE